MTEVVIPYVLKGRFFGGLERVIQSVSSEIDAFDFEILTPEPDEVIAENFEDVSFRSFKKRVPGWGLDYRRPAIKRILDEYDLIWNHSLMLNDIAAGSSTPSVTTFHSVEHTPPTSLPLTLRGVKDRIEWKLLMRGLRYMPRCERVVAVSNRSRNVIERRTGAGAARIYNGADYLGSELSKTDESYMFSAESPGAAVYVSGKTGFPVKVLGGDDWLKSLADRVDAEAEFIEGFVNDERLRELYSNCSFYISGDRTDGFGLTPLEANHFGKPCIVFDKEVHDENMEDGVNGFRAANMYEMVEKTRVLVEDRELRSEMGESAHEYAQRFTWEKAAKRYREEFRSVVG